MVVNRFNIPMNKGGLGTTTVRRKVWLIDKEFFPPPYPVRNRYRILFDIRDADVTVFSARTFRKDVSASLQEAVKNDWVKKTIRWITLPSISANRFLFYLSFAFSLLVRTLTTREKPDVILASCPDPFQSLVGLIVAKVKKAKYLVDFRDYWPELLWKLGMLPENGCLSKFIFCITKILARYSDAVLCPESVFIREYLRVRKVCEKKIFIRENIYLHPIVRNGNLDLLRSRIFRYPIIQEMNSSRNEGKKVLLMAGTLNIGDRRIEEVQQLLNACQNNISLIILSNDKKYARLVSGLSGVEFKIYKPIPYEDFLFVLRSSDALLYFVETIAGSLFSSNKIFDALSVGTPVILGIFDRSCVGDENLPGVFKFYLDYLNIEEFRNIISILPVHESIKVRMKHYCIEKYNEQLGGFQRFLEEIVKEGY